jgi:hypothetical protein
MTASPYPRAVTGLSLALGVVVSVAAVASLDCGGQERAASVTGLAGTGGSAMTGAGGDGGRASPAGAGGASAGVAGSPASRGGQGGPTAPAPQAGMLMGDVALSLPSQSFKGTLMVGMATTIPGAEIRFTIDGTLPTDLSPVYAAPLALTATTQVRAQPFLSGAAVGLVTTGIYIARSFDLTSELPIVLLDDYGKGASTSKTTYLDAAVMIFEPVGGTASLANLPTVATRAGFHLRGQSSASFPQKPYKVEFRDNADADAKYAVAGMPADADWALIAPYYDRALMRNPFTYTLGREMGLMAPRTANVEVYLNFASRPVSETDYQGIYWWSETIKISGHRMDLARLKAEDVTTPEITGGYIFKFDQLGTDAAAPHLTCKTSTGVTCWTDCELTDPVPLPAPTEQLAYITDYVQRFHDTLFTTPLGDYGQYIDVASFVDYLIINELTRNSDAYNRSAYFNKDENALLRGGPLWDYNFALGVGTAVTASPAPTSSADGGWQFQGATPGSLPRRNTSGWFPRLMADPAFAAQVKARWKSLRGGLLSQAQLEARLDTLAAKLPAASVERDFARWPVSTPYPPTTGAGTGGGGFKIVGPTDPTWEGQVKGMHDFLIARLAWMDSQWQ